MDNKKYKRKNEVKFAKDKIKNNYIYYIFVAVVIIAVVVIAYITNGYSFDFVNEYNPRTDEVKVVDKLNDLKITFIDVGQGDSILVNFPDGKNMLIDGGGEGDESQLDKYLQIDGKKIKIDYCVATHSDADHIGFLDYVYKNYDVDYSFRPYVKYNGDKSGLCVKDDFNNGNITHNTKTYYDYLDAVYSEWNGKHCEFFDDGSDFTNTFSVNGVEYSYTVDFKMAFAKEYTYMDFDDTNNMSAVIYIEYLGRKILLAGDMEEEEEQEFISSYNNVYYTQYVDCDVLKVGHHGSKTSSSVEFLNLVKPEYAVISCGFNSSYKHPTEKTLTNLLNKQVELYRTDLMGDIILTISFDEMSNKGQIAFSYEYSGNNAYLWDSYSEMTDDDRTNIKTNKNV